MCVKENYNGNKLSSLKNVNCILIGTHSEIMLNRLPTDLLACSLNSIVKSLICYLPYLVIYWVLCRFLVTAILGREFSNQEMVKIVTGPAQG